MTLKMAGRRASVTDPNTWLKELADYFTPSSNQFDGAKGHKDSIESRLNYDIGVYRMFEIGSLRHGTGVWLHSDADYLVSLKGDKPGSSTTMLDRVKNSLKARFPSTTIVVRRPAVVCYFTDGVFEVVPGYFADSTNNNSGYWIADPANLGGWMKTYPEAHNDYVNGISKKHNGGAKQLARLVKVWKYERNVPVSSCYLEIRAAKHMSGETSYVPVWDLYFTLKSIYDGGLAAMNDPTGLGSRFTACSSDSNKSDALSKLATAVARATKAKDFYTSNEYDKSVEQLKLLFDR